MTVRGDICGELFHLFESKFLVGHFASAEPERDFHLHLFAEEIDGMTQFDPEIVPVDLRTELNLFDFVGVLMLAGLLVLLGLLVAILAEIDQPADGWGGGGSDLDQVNTLGASQINGIGQRENAQLLAVDPDDPDSGTR